jgi:hypothetical protein
MTTLIIELPPGAYDQLRKRARQAGKPPEVLSQEILEEALQENAPFRKSARDILQAVGRLRPLGTALRRKIIPGVTLEEVRASMVKTGGPSLSEIVLTQRGDRR